MPRRPKRRLYSSPEDSTWTWHPPSKLLHEKKTPTSNHRDWDKGTWRGATNKQRRKTKLTPTSSHKIEKTRHKPKKLLHGEPNRHANNQKQTIAKQTEAEEASTCAADPKSSFLETESWRKPMKERPRTTRNRSSVTKPRNLTNNKPEKGERRRETG